MRPLALLALLASCLGAACSGCSGSPSPNVIAPTIATVVCILNQVSQCEAASTPWATCTANTIAACGTDVATIVNVWDAHVAAEVREGFVPRPIPGAP